MLRKMRLSVAGLFCGLLLCSPQITNAQQSDIVDTAVAAGSFKTLATALKAADLVEALKGPGPFTVFAPTDDAFAKLPAETIQSLLKPESKESLAAILSYHVVSGKVLAKDVVGLKHAPTLNGQRIDIAVKNGTVSIDGATVTATDIQCSNGVVHIIDTVILPSTDNIAATAKKAGKFGTLLAAAKAAGLVDALSGKDALTVFAPTDEAFAKLPAGTVENLLKPENKEQLKNILLYHVVAGRVYSDQVVGLTEAETLAGQKIGISVKGSSVKFNDSGLVAADVEASNGVIHVIDAVMLPPAKDAVSQVAPKATIEHAVAQGAALYNSGHHAACAQHYMSTISGLLQHQSSLPSGAASHLHSALNNARHTTCADTQSWTLRHGLDAAYVSILNAR